MYQFAIKETGPGIETLVIRPMLVLAAGAAFFYVGNQHYLVNVISGAALLVMSVFFTTILARFKLKRMVLLLIAALFLVAATRAWSFSLILLLYGYFAKYLHQQPRIGISSEGVVITQLFSKKTFHWSDFSNLVLKDKLLTLDFNNNKLLQLDIDETSPPIDATTFNQYCTENILEGKRPSAAMDGVDHASTI